MWLSVLMSLLGVKGSACGLSCWVGALRPSSICFAYCDTPWGGWYVPASTYLVGGVDFQGQTFQRVGPE